MEGSAPAPAPPAPAPPAPAAPAAPPPVAPTPPEDPDYDKRNASTCVTCSGKKKKKKKYKTRDQAAKAAMKQYNASSIKDNREYGGFIEKNPDGTYSLGDVNRGGVDGVQLPKEEGDTAGWWHTHGAADPAYDSEHFSGLDGDKGVSKYYDVPGYVATPSGKMLRYDPGTDTVTRLSGTTK